MQSRAHCPDRGDIVWLNFTPQAGREQAGRRPALVLSPISYNRKSGHAVACPITSQVKGYPFEVILPGGLSVNGAVLCDHLRSIDWQERRATRIARASETVLAEVTAKLMALLEIED